MFTSRSSRNNNDDYFINNRINRVSNVSCYGEELIYMQSLVTFGWCLLIGAVPIIITIDRLTDYITNRRNGSIQKEKGSV